MAVKRQRVVSFIYQKTLRNQLRLINLGLIGPTTKLQLTFQGNCDAAYTTITGKDKDTFRVVIGGRMVSKAAVLPETFDSKKTLKSYVPAIKAAFKGLNYHEMGHVLFSDMTMTKLLEYNAKYRGFVLQLFNVLEDPIIELNISKHVEKNRPYDKSPRIYIDFIKKKIFEPMCDDYVDKKNLSSFLQYLLLMLRCGKDNIKGTNEVYEKYNTELLPKIKDILTELDGTIRQVKTVKLADWMIKNIEEFASEWDKMEEPEDLKPSPEGSVSSPMKASKGISHPERGLTEGMEDTAHERGPDEEKGPDKDDSDDDDSKSDAGEDTTVPDIDECFEDLLNSSYDHEFVIAADEYTISDPDRLEEEINKQITKSKECIQNMTKFFTLFKGRKKPRRTPGFTSGRLNVPQAMQDEARDGCETKLFTRNVVRGQMVDLAVSLVCDNSGSMTGRKSTLASIAALALAQACEWSKIPFECSCFTKTCDSSSGTSITIIEKEIDEPFEKMKPYFGINDDDLIHYLKSERRIPTFCGNSEEVNLFHIWKKFRKVSHKTKLMFVFCDGATTGSRDSLKTVIKRMEQDNIFVIGIGLMAPEVKTIYPHHRVFNSYDEMQRELSPYLVKTLSEFATK